MSEQFTTVIAVVGRPNAGKSSLINQIVGQKIVITSHRPQTTRHRIHAIHTVENYQFIFIDTPGINQSSSTTFLKELNKASRSAVADAQIILFVLDGLRWDQAEDAILNYIPVGHDNVMVIINKLDRYRQQQKRVTEFIAALPDKFDFSEIIPLSTKRKKDIVYLEGVLKKHAVQGEFMFSPEQCTDQNMRFYISELVREQIMRRYNQEIPYSAAVIVDKFQDTDKSLNVSATIHVEQESHRQIIVGNGGKGIREIGKQTRQQLENDMGKHVDIRLWVKVSRSWSTNPKLLREFGYES